MDELDSRTSSVNKLKFYYRTVKIKGLKGYSLLENNRRGSGLDFNTYNAGYWGMVISLEDFDGNLYNIEIDHVGNTFYKRK